MGMHTDSAIPLRMRVAAFAVLLALVFASYGFAARCAFISLDDSSHVTANEMVQRGLTADGVAQAFRESHASLYIPLSWLGHMAMSSMFGMDAAAHHLLNVAIHALNACLLLGALFALTRDWRPSFAVAVLFAVHPINVESVVWVAELKNVLSTTFWLLAMLAYAIYSRTTKLKWLGAAWLAMLIGCLAKPMLVTLPCALLLLDGWPLGRWRKGNIARLFAEKIPFVLLSVLFSIAASRAAADKALSYETLTLGTRLASAAVGWSNTVGHLFVPMDFAVIYPVPVPFSIPVFISALVLLASALGLALLVWRRAPWVTMGIFWFTGILVPVAGIVQVGSQSMADRFAYIPQIGIWCAVVWSARALLPAWRGWPAVLTVVAVSLAVLCHFQTRNWRDSITLFESSIHATDRNYVLHQFCGYEYFRQGRYREAAHHLREYTKILPRNAEVLTFLGDSLAASGEPIAAIKSYDDALSVAPDFLQAKASRQRLIDWIAAKAAAEKK